MRSAIKYGYISTLAPAGGATYHSSHHLGLISFLLSPLREGRRLFGGGGSQGAAISTLAPAGGATTMW